MKIISLISNGISFLENEVDEGLFLKIMKWIGKSLLVTFLPTLLVGGAIVLIVSLVMFLIVPTGLVSESVGEVTTISGEVVNAISMDANDRYQFYSDMLDIQRYYEPPEGYDEYIYEYDLPINVLMSVDSILNDENAFNDENIKQIIEKTLVFKESERIEYNTKKVAGSEDDYDEVIEFTNVETGEIEKSYLKNEEEEIKVEILTISSSSLSDIKTIFKLDDEEYERLVFMQDAFETGLLDDLVALDYSLNMYDSSYDPQNLIEYSEGNRNIPYFSQLDKRWGNTMYGKSGTIAQAGCSPSSTAMVVSGLSGTKITPEEMSNWYVVNGYRAEGQGSYWSGVPASLEAYGLQVNKISRRDKNELREALKRGNPVVAIMGRGHFTSGGHFIVLVGITEDDEVIVNDPASSTRTEQQWSLDLIMREASNKGMFTFWEAWKE